MKVGVYFCRCGGIVSEKVDGAQLEALLKKSGEDAYFTTIDLACSDDGKAQIVEDIGKNKPDRVVFVACSPREHEPTFQGVLATADMNPFLMQMVNAREHVAWVTENAEAATEKAFHQILAAVRRVRLHEPLDRQQIEVTTDTLIIGAGPAGLKAALTLAEAGRKVVLVEKGPILGGMPVRYQEVFPKLECGPCVLEPFMAEVLHGPHAANIEILLLSELAEIKGSFGNFEVKIKKAPRYVDVATCIGCGACIPSCPASEKNPVNCGLNERKAIDFIFFGGLPNAPYLEPKACHRFQGKECKECAGACPVEGAINYDDKEQVVERTVGAILIAIGADLYDCSKLPNLGYGKLPDVVTSLEMERILSASGPTGGEVKLSDGRAPERVAIIHCVGSLDENHKEYCSGVCCLAAFKFNALLAHKVPGVKVTHYYKTVTVPGKDEYELWRRTAGEQRTTMVRYTDVSHLAVEPGKDGRKTVRLGGESQEFDLVVLMPATVPRESAAELSKLLEVTVDRHGFFEELHGRVDAMRSKVRGIYLAGTCQSPMDLSKSMTHGASAAGLVMSALVPGRKLDLEAIHAAVDSDRCSGCKSCVAVCPYKAVAFNEKEEVAEVNPVLCLGCGTCVAACPSGAIKGRHFTTEQIFAEIEGALI